MGACVCMCAWLCCLQLIQSGKRCNQHDHSSGSCSVTISSTWWYVLVVPSRTRTKQSSLSWVLPSTLPSTPSTTLCAGLTAGRMTLSQRAATAVACHSSFSPILATRSMSTVGALYAQRTEEYPNKDALKVHSLNVKLERRHLEVHTHSHTHMHTQ